MGKKEGEELHTRTYEYSTYLHGITSTYTSVLQLSRSLSRLKKNLILSAIFLLSTFYIFSLACLRQQGN